jgi:hypothetical protein
MFGGSLFSLNILWGYYCPIMTEIEKRIRYRLKPTNVVNDIQSYQLNWKQLVDRMGENIFPKKLLNYKVTGTRDIGRPRS